MSRIWLIFSGIGIFWLLNVYVPNFRFQIKEEEKIPILLYDAPKLSSSSNTYFIHSTMLSTNYEFCDFYRVIIRQQNGITIEKHLYKKANEISEYNLEIVHTNSFQKKDCNLRPKKKRKQLKKFDPNTPFYLPPQEPNYYPFDKSRIYKAPPQHEPKKKENTKVTFG